MKNAKRLIQNGRRQLTMPSALWFVGGVFVGMMVSCVLFLFVMGAHEDDYDGFEETK